MTKKIPVIVSDEALSRMRNISFGFGAYGMGHVNYAELSELMTNGLIRAGVESISDAMTSEWITLSRPGDGKDDEQDENLARIRKDMERLKVQDVFSKASQLIGYFGGCLVYIDTGEVDPEALKRPLFEARQTLQGRLKRLVVVEPASVTPGPYNTMNPLSEDYFKPKSWSMAGSVEVHASRFLYFSSGELPTRIRQKYNFFGIPIAQTAAEYVASFLDARSSAGRLLGKLSRTVFKTPMQELLSTGKAADLDNRIQFAAHYWDNSGILAIDAQNEDIVEISGNLTGATDIVRQSLEMVAAIFRVPVMKLLGISPSGLNATGDADLRNHYETIGRLQEKQLNEPLSRLLKLIQLHLFGEVDQAITFEWNPLDEVTEEQRSAINGQNVGTVCQAVDSGVVSVEEARTALVALGVPGFDDLDISSIPDQEEAEEEYEAPDYVGPDDIESGGTAPQDMSLNGDQVASMVDVVTKVAIGQIPRESGLNIILAAYPVSREAAEGILGEAGRDFVPLTSSEAESGTPDA